MAVGFFFKCREFVFSVDINRGSPLKKTPAPAQMFLTLADWPLKIEAEQAEILNRINPN
jgi:hypothetical protein